MNLFIYLSCQERLRNAGSVSDTLYSKKYKDEEEIGEDKLSSMLGVM